MVTRLLIHLQGVRGSILSKARNTSLLHGVQTSSGFQPSYFMSTGNISSTENQLLLETDHSLPRSAEAMNALSYISTPPYTHGIARI